MSFAPIFEIGKILQSGTSNENIWNWMAQSTMANRIHWTKASFWGLTDNRSNIERSLENKIKIRKLQSLQQLHQPPSLTLLNVRLIEQFVINQRMNEHDILQLLKSCNLSLCVCPRHWLAIYGVNFSFLCTVSLFGSFSSAARCSFADIKFQNFSAIIKRH